MINSIKAIFLNNMLKGKKFIFLGSSVTYGDNGYSFVESLKIKEDIVILKKEAVSGTTLVTLDDNSYIPRMERIDKNLNPDFFICQLSTNDASLKLPLGIISKDNNFDQKTVAGAIEYIIYYVEKTYNKKVIFYTGTKYNSKEYNNMVKFLYELKKKWNINIIDLWNDIDMNSIDKKLYDSYMKDPIHPNKNGYDEWWTPKFIEVLNSLCKV